MDAPAHIVARRFAVGGRSRFRRGGAHLIVRRRRFLAQGGASRIVYQTSAQSIRLAIYSTPSFFSQRLGQRLSLFLKRHFLSSHSSVSGIALRSVADFACSFASFIPHQPGFSRRLFSPPPRPPLLEPVGAQNSVCSHPCRRVRPADSEPRLAAGLRHQLLPQRGRRRQRSPWIPHCVAYSERMREVRMLDFCTSSTDDGTQ